MVATTKRCIEVRVWLHKFELVETKHAPLTAGHVWGETRYGFSWAVQRNTVWTDGGIARCWGSRHEMQQDMETEGGLAFLLDWESNPAGLHHFISDRLKAGDDVLLGVNGAPIQRLVLSGVAIVLAPEEEEYR